MVAGERFNLSEYRVDFPKGNPKIRGNSNIESVFDCLSTVIDFDFHRFRRTSQEVIGGRFWRVGRTIVLASADSDRLFQLQIVDRNLLPTFDLLRNKLPGLAAKHLGRKCEGEYLKYVDMQTLQGHNLPEEVLEVLNHWWYSN